MMLAFITDGMNVRDGAMFWSGWVALVVVFVVIVVIERRQR